MAQRRRTDEAVEQLRGLTRDATARELSAPPPGYEQYHIDWSRLTPGQAAIVCAFADALREIREMELDLLRIGTVDYVRAMCAELRRQNTEIAAALRGDAEIR
jgi:hypothetical protein